VKKRAVLVLLGIALVGVLVIALLSTTKPDGTPVAPDHAAVDTPAVTPEASAPLQAEKISPEQQREHVVSTDSASSPQVPALEPKIRKALGKILNTSSEGLVEETRNGATSVDLEGRFQTAPVATIDKDGNIQITDYSHLPGKAKQP